MIIRPEPNYLSIWRFAFFLLRKHSGLLALATLVLAAPFFILNSVASARHIMMLGGASIMGAEVPSDRMRVLWGSLVGADSLASIALGIAVLLAFRYLAAERGSGFARYAGAELPRLLRSAGFRLFAIEQLVAFACINLADGGAKFFGTVLLGCSILLWLSSQDRPAPAARGGLPRLTWRGWIHLALVVLTIPLLHIFFNGYVNAVMLMLADFGAQQIVRMFDLDLASPALPYGVIMLSKFLSQWLNLLSMVLLLSACLALRGAASEAEAI